MTIFFEVMGVDFNMKIAIFACGHDKSTNISCITKNVSQECLG